ncbi:MYO5 [Mytilus coruscus]|uniref:MYO5 n=1 Tax=Mytilus coruscus TaxID=42192 RepID=A0A6J8APD5_MYTCO|nr:MYO5 [Mytilus coruscus]
MEKHSEVDTKLRIDYDSMCNKIAQELTTDNLKEIKFLLRRDIGKATWERIKDGRDLVPVLENLEYFTRNEVTKLEKLLTDAKVSSLATVVRQYSDCIPRMLNIDDDGNGVILCNLVHLQKALKAYWYFLRVFRELELKQYSGNLAFNVESSYEISEFCFHLPTRKISEKCAIVKQTL